MENNEYTEEDIKDLQALLSDTLHQLQIASGHNSENKCECKHLTLLCLKHGCIRGSEMCERCDGVRCFNDMK